MIQEYTDVADESLFEDWSDRIEELFRAALSGGILAGKIFPQIPISLNTESFWTNTGASIF